MVMFRIKVYLDLINPIRTINKIYLIFVFLIFTTSYSYSNPADSCYTERCDPYSEYQDPYSEYQDPYSEYQDPYSEMYTPSCELTGAC